MGVISLVLVVWIVAAIGICIMEKIQPEDKIYPVWAVFVCIVLTIFIVWYVFSN